MNRAATFLATAKAVRMKNCTASSGISTRRRRSSLATNAWPCSQPGSSRSPICWITSFHTTKPRTKNGCGLRTGIRWLLDYERILEGLSLLARSVADQENAARAREPRGQRRRYPKSKNFYVTLALNSLLQEYGLSQFCVEEAEVSPGHTRRFVVRGS
jgi:hypothetical protein